MTEIYGKTGQGGCYEYKCGCIQHTHAGLIRRCPGMPSRSTSGKMVAKPDNAEQKHNQAMNDDPVRTYNVAAIVP